jgi:hypothetical protein
MRRIPLAATLIAVLLTVAACDSAGPDLATSGIPAADQQARINVCHYDSADDSFHLITVGAPAVAAHLRHGDGLPGDPVPGQSGFSFGPACEIEADPPPGLPHQVVVDPPSAAAGIYGATGAAFGPPPTAAGVAGPFVVVQAVSGVATQGCDALIGFPAGAIAVVDRGNCPFVEKAVNAQNAGAVAMVVVNNTAAAPVNMGGDDPGLLIPSVMISLADGATVKAGLPASGTVRLAQ